MSPARRQTGCLKKEGGSPATLASCVDGRASGSARPTPVPQQSKCASASCDGYGFVMTSMLELWLMPTVAAALETAVPNTVPCALAVLVSDL